MAVLNDDKEILPDDQSRLLERLETIEKWCYEMNVEMSEMQIEMISQAMQMENVLKRKDKSSLSFHKAWKERLIFKQSAIDGDGVWRGPVEQAMGGIMTDLDKYQLLSSSYIGATCDPERRFKEHMRNLFPIKSKPSSKGSPSMKILYHTTQMTKAADVESRLLGRFRMTRNVSSSANGMLFGKPSYFVYILKHVL